MKTSVILASWLFLAATFAGAQEEGTEAPADTSELPPAETLPSLEEMSRAESDAPVEEETTPAPAEESPSSDAAVPADEVPSEEASSEAPKEAPPPATAQENAPVAAPQETVEASSASSSNSSLRGETGRYGSDFGSFRIGLGAGRPEFDEKVVKYYDDLYGKPRFHPDIFLDYYFFDWYLTFGVGARLSYYRANGYAAQTSNPTGDTLSEDEIDRNSNVELVLVPLQGVITMEITPWRTSFFTLNAWTGIERLYVQETRHPQEASGFIAADSNGDADATYVSRGWNTGSVVGASVSLRLDYFDRASVNSLAIMGFRSVFLTPYMEIIKTQKGDMGKWDRRVLGLLFTFESIH